MNGVRQDHLSVSSDLTLLNDLQDWFKQFCLQHSTRSPWLEEQIYPLNLALAEGFTNAVRHAHQGLPEDTTIEIDLLLKDNQIEIHIWDQGSPFNPDALEEPEPGTLHEGGYGWFLLRRLADQVLYRRNSDNRNCLVIVKHRVEQSVTSLP